VRLRVRFASSLPAVFLDGFFHILRSSSALSHTLLSGRATEIINECSRSLLA